MIVVRGMRNTTTHNRHNTTHATQKHTRHQTATQKHTHTHTHHNTHTHTHITHLRRAPIITPTVSHTHGCPHPHTHHRHPTLSPHSSAGSGVGCGVAFFRTILIFSGIAVGRSCLLEDCLWGEPFRSERFRLLLSDPLRDPAGHRIPVCVCVRVVCV